MQTLHAGLPIAVTYVAAALCCIRLAVKRKHTRLLSGVVLFRCCLAFVQKAIHAVIASQHSLRQETRPNQVNNGRSVCDIQSDPTFHQEQHGAGAQQSIVYTHTKITTSEQYQGSTCVHTHTTTDPELDNYFCTACTTGHNTFDPIVAAVVLFASYMCVIHLLESCSLSGHVAAPKSRTF